MHGETKTKYIKHTKVEGKYACKICDHHYTHSTNLKLHILKSHGKEELLENNIEPAQIFFKPCKVKPQDIKIPELVALKREIENNDFPFLS